jgi:hypothetical protein
MATFAIPLALAGLSGLAGFFGGKPKTTTTTQDMNQSQTGSYNQFQTPELSAEQQQLVNTFLPALVNRYRSGPADLSGYAAGGLRDINTASDLKTKSIQNMLAARGLSYSPAAMTPFAGQETSRVGQQSSFLSQIPLLQRQMQGEDIQNLVKGFSSLPTGYRAGGTSQQNVTGHATGTSTSPNQQWSGLLGGLGSALGPFLGAKWADDMGLDTNPLGPKK